MAGAHSSELTTDAPPVASVAEATSTGTRSDDTGFTDDDERAEDKLTEEAGCVADETATNGSVDDSGAGGTFADDAATFAEDCTALDVATADDGVTGTADERGTSTAEEGFTGAEVDDFAAEDGGAAEDTAGAVAADDTAVEAELTGGTS